MQAAGCLSPRRADRQFYTFLTDFAGVTVSSMEGSHIGFNMLSGCNLGGVHILARPWRRPLFATHPPFRAFTTADGTRTSLQTTHVHDGGPSLCPPEFPPVTANYDPNQDSDPETVIASWQAAQKSHDAYGFLDLLSGLNAEQQAAVIEPPGPIRVVAGPGSGKTRVMTHRVAHLILNEGVKPYEILVGTDTNVRKKRG